MENRKTTAAENRLTEIGSYERTPMGQRLIYSMWRKENGEYAISVAGGVERESCVLGRDLFSAMDFFRRVVEGQVFPYSLSELVEDYWKEASAEGENIA